jgi:hypothetical protein
VMDLSGLRRYRGLDELLADPAIDLVDVCNPTHLHSETANGRGVPQRPLMYKSVITSQICAAQG